MALTYAMTLIVFLSFSTSLVVCCDPVYLYEVPFRKKPFMTYIARVPEPENQPIDYSTRSVKMANLSHLFFKKVANFSTILLLTVIPIYCTWQLVIYLIHYLQNIW